VRRLGAADVEPEALAWPDFTYRHYWGSYRGWVDLTLNTSWITHGSNVLASASESSELATNTDPIPHPFLGSARFTIHNVVPLDGGVSVRMYIDWGSPLYTQVTYVVVNP
jgi:hypothetical protein